ncbi:protein LBH-like [Xyrichtys novacula]|uniref:Protein LBH-like n=1 Tax=Xyrichtys novacula TaxID=13765 RepID=A0AAV1GNN1_XYRNO|nr:protein LBH-like [Xyrichtys novacula]
MMLPSGASLPEGSIGPLSLRRLRTLRCERQLHRSGGRRPSCSETLDLPADRMTEVMNSLEPATEDFSGGGAAADQGAIFPETHERNPKLSKRLPSIVVEPTDATEVESGELRWPPDEPSSPDAKSGRTVAEEETADDFQLNVDEEASGAEMQDTN